MTEREIIRVSGARSVPRRQPEQQSREQGWNSRFVLGSIPSYDAARDRHCALLTVAAKRRKRRAPSGKAMTPQGESPPLKLVAAPSPAPAITVTESPPRDSLLDRATKDVVQAWTAEGVPEELYAVMLKAAEATQKTRATALAKELENCKAKQSALVNLFSIIQSREASISKLREYGKTLSVRSLTEAETSGLHEALLLHRVLTVQAVEAVAGYRKYIHKLTQCERSLYRAPVMYNGCNYLLQLKTDTAFLGTSPLNALYEFSAKSDPFFIVPATQWEKRSRRELPFPSTLGGRVTKAENVLIEETYSSREFQKLDALRSSLRKDDWAKSATRKAEAAVEEKADPSLDASMKQEPEEEGELKDSERSVRNLSSSVVLSSTSLSVPAEEANCSEEGGTASLQRHTVQTEPDIAPTPQGSVALDTDQEEDVSLHVVAPAEALLLERADSLCSVSPRGTVGRSPTLVMPADQREKASEKEEAIVAAAMDSSRLKEAERPPSKPEPTSSVAFMRRKVAPSLRHSVGVKTSVERKPTLPAAPQKKPQRALKPEIRTDASPLRPVPPTARTAQPGPRLQTTANTPQPPSAKAAQLVPRRAFKTPPPNRPFATQSPMTSSHLIVSMSPPVKRGAEKKGQKVFSPQSLPNSETFHRPASRKLVASMDISHLPLPEEVESADIGHSPTAEKPITPVDTSQQPVENDLVSHSPEVIDQGSTGQLEPVDTSQQPVENDPVSHSPEVIDQGSTGQLEPVDTSQQPVENDPVSHSPEVTDQRSTDRLDQVDTSQMPAPKEQSGLEVVEAVEESPSSAVQFPGVPPSLLAPWDISFDTFHLDARTLEKSMEEYISSLPTAMRETFWSADAFRDITSRSYPALMKLTANGRQVGTLCLSIDTLSTKTKRVNVTHISAESVSDLKPVLQRCLEFIWEAYPCDEVRIAVNYRDIDGALHADPQILSVLHSSGCRWRSLSVNSTGRKTMTMFIRRPEDAPEKPFSSLPLFQENLVLKYAFAAQTGDSVWTEAEKDLSSLIGPLAAAKELGGVLGDTGIGRMGRALVALASKLPVKFKFPATRVRRSSDPAEALKDARSLRLSVPARDPGRDTVGVCSCVGLRFPSFDTCLRRSAQGLVEYIRIYSAEINHAVLDSRSVYFIPSDDKPYVLMVISLSPDDSVPDAFEVATDAVVRLTNDYAKCTDTISEIWLPGFTTAVSRELPQFLGVETPSGRIASCVESLELTLTAPIHSIGNIAVRPRKGVVVVEESFVIGSFYSALLNRKIDDLCPVPYSVATVLQSQFTLHDQYSDED